MKRRQHQTLGVIQAKHLRSVTFRWLQQLQSELAATRTAEASSEVLEALPHWPHITGSGQPKVLAELPENLLQDIFNTFPVLKSMVMFQTGLAIQDFETTEDHVCPKGVLSKVPRHIPPERFLEAVEQYMRTWLVRT